MSVEMYPTLEALDERLAVLEDPLLAERLVAENPALYPSAAAQEEITVFASAWRRAGTFALALTAAASIVAGYILTPLVTKHNAPVPVAQHHTAPPAAAHHRVAHPIAPVRHAAIVNVVVPVHHTQPAPIPVHHAAPVRHLTSVHVAKAPASIPVRHIAPASEAQPQVDRPAEPEAAPQSSVDTSVASAPAPSTDTQVAMPDGTKPAPPAPPPTVGRGGGWSEHWPAGIGGVIIGRTVDPCTPQGGRIGTVLSSVAGQVLSRAISRGF